MTDNITHMLIRFISSSMYVSTLSFEE